MNFTERDGTVIGSSTKREGRFELQPLGVHQGNRVAHYKARKEGEENWEYILLIWDNHSAELKWWNLESVRLGNDGVHLAWPSEDQS
jgi:hypothetical protein